MTKDTSKERAVGYPLTPNQAKQMYGSMDRQMNGWTDGQMHGLCGWTERQMDRSKSPKLYPQPIYGTGTIIHIIKIYHITIP